MDHPQNEKLKRERLLAMQALGRSDDLSELTNNLVNLSTNAPEMESKLNKTEYIRPRKLTTINISDLNHNETIDILSTPQKSTFEPSEFTARSTQNFREPIPFLQDYQTTTIEEILAASCDENIRSIGDSMRESLANGVDLPEMCRISSTSSASCSEFEWGEIKSSINKNKDHWDMSLASLNGNLQECSKELPPVNEIFKPGEEMVTQLVADEVSWEQKYADIPRTKDDDVVFAYFSKYLERSYANSVGNNMSIGKYFNNKSETLSNILPNAKSPPSQNRKPLIENSLISSTGDASPEKDRNSMLDISDINKAMRSNESTSIIIDRLLKGTKSQELATKDSQTKPLDKNSNHKKIANQSTSTQFSDTASFSESMFKSLGISPIPMKTNLSVSQNSVDSAKGKTYNITELNAENVQNNLVVKPDYTNTMKRRSNSASRFKENIPIPLPSNKRSRSPNNAQEMGAVANYNCNNHANRHAKTPEKSNIKSGNKLQENKNCLTPNKQFHSQTNSPMNSPGSVASFDKTNDMDRLMLSKNKSPICHGKLSLPNRVADSALFGNGSPAKAVRSASQCSTGSVDSLSGANKLPIKSTHGEISWGSVKLRRSEKESFNIKNVSSKKINLKFSIDGPGFQFAGSEDKETVCMQSNECRLISVLFCPTVIGAATGNLKIQHYNSPLEINIPLYAYGGEANIKIEGIQRPPIGQPFICLGNIQHLSEPLSVQIVLNNKGTLPGFAIIHANAKSFINSESLHIHPQAFLIPPNSKKHVTIEYKPKRDEIKKLCSLNTEVVCLYTLNVLTGDEPSRRRVQNRIKLYKDGTTQAAFRNFFKYTANIEASENVQEVCTFKEYLKASTIDTWKTLKENEIILTATNYLDETMLNVSLNDDQTMLFKTFYSTENALKGIITEDNTLQKFSSDETNFVCKYKNNGSGEYLKITPSELDILPGNKEPVKLLLKSNFYKMETFEIDSNFSHLFHFNPKEGLLRPNEKIEIDVYMPFGTLPSEQIFVWVFVENEKLKIPVNVNKGGIRSHLR